MGGEGDGVAVQVDESLLLKSVANDGEIGGPDVVDAPEEDKGKQDVVVRVQGTLFREDAVRWYRVRVGDEAEVVVGVGQLLVARAF